MTISSLIKKLQSVAELNPNAEVAVVAGDDAFLISSIKFETVISEADDSMTAMVSINCSKGV